MSSARTNAMWSSTTSMSSTMSSAKSTSVDSFHSAVSSFGTINYSLDNFREELIDTIANYQYQELQYRRLSTTLTEVEYEAGKNLLTEILASPYDNDELKHQAEAVLRQDNWDLFYETLTKYLWEHIYLRNERLSRQPELVLFKIAKLFSQPDGIFCSGPSVPEPIRDPYFPVRGVKPAVALTILYLYAKKIVKEKEESERKMTVSRTTSTPVRPSTPSTAPMPLPVAAVIVQPQKKSSARPQSLFGQVIRIGYSIWNNRSNFVPSSSTTSSRSHKPS